MPSGQNTPLRSNILKTIVIQASYGLVDIPKATGSRNLSCGLRQPKNKIRCGVSSFFVSYF